MGGANLTAQEKKTVGIAALALAVFLVASGSNLHNTFFQENYLGIHLILEFFSMAVAFAIAMQSWLTYPHTGSNQRIYLGAVFLAVGSLDLLHTLSFKGMPFFLTDSSVPKATWFWVAARGTEALALALLLLRRDSQRVVDRRGGIYLLSLAYVFILSYATFYWYQALPVLVVNGQGVTDLKILIEYLIGLLHLLTAAVLLLRYRQQPRPRTSQRFLILALVFLLLGELIFTLYRDVYDFYNFLGHIYKVAGYFCLLRSLYVLTVEEPFVRERAALQRLEELVAQRTDKLQEINRELLVRNQELESLCYSISHDLRTPLRGIDGFSQLLLEDYQQHLDEAGQDYLLRVRIASQRMGQLFDDLLRLSKVTRQPLEQVEFSLSLMATEIMRDLQREDPGRRVQLKITPDLKVTGDQRLLYLALQNLLANAWKFTAQTPDAVIELGCQQQEQRVYYIRDNGAGFEMDYVQKLFQPFQRLHAIDEFPGTGIGLAIVKRVLDRHDGRSWAEGRVLQGATFYFTLGTEE